MKLYPLYPILLLIIATTSSPSHAEESSDTAQHTVEAWLSHLDNADYDKTWQHTAPLFQAQVDQQAWANMAHQARRPLGEFKSRALIGAAYHSQLPGALSGDYIVFQYRTTFENKTDAVETVTPMLVEGRWLVSGYFVR